MIEFINQLRARRKGMEVSSQEHIVEAAVEGAVLRLRPIMMTMLVATLGLLPAALSHAIGSDSQRPFAIVIVGGLLANLVIGVFLLPTLYVWVAARRRRTARSRNQRRFLGLGIRESAIGIQQIRKYSVDPSMRLFSVA